MNPVLQHINPAIQALSPYQPGRPINEIMREQGITDVVKLASNENPLGAGAAALAALKNLDADTLARYPDSNANALRQALSRALSVAAENLIIGNGSNEILELAASLMLEKGSIAVYSEHAFIVYKLATVARHATAHTVAAKNFAADLPMMSAAARADKVRLMFIANPNNPTGTWHPVADIRRLLEETPPHVLVVLDEAYCEYTDTPDASLALLRDFPNLLITRTFSKVHGLAGLRAGYGIADQAIAAMINRIRQPFNMNAVAQAVATAALGDHAHVKNSVNANREGMLLLTQAFNKLNIEFIPSQANFIAFRAPIDSARLYEKMLGKGFIIRPLHEYDMREWLRITVGTQAQNEKFLRLLADCR